MSSTITKSSDIFLARLVNDSVQWCTSTVIGTKELKVMKLYGHSSQETSFSLTSHTLFFIPLCPYPFPPDGSALWESHFPMSMSTGWSDRKTDNLSSLCTQKRYLLYSTCSENIKRIQNPELWDLFSPEKKIWWKKFENVYDIDWSENVIMF